MKKYSLIFLFCIALSGCETLQEIDQSALAFLGAIQQPAQNNNQYIPPPRPYSPYSMPLPPKPQQRDHFGNMLQQVQEAKRMEAEAAFRREQLNAQKELWASQAYNQRVQAGLFKGQMIQLQRKSSLEDAALANSLALNGQLPADGLAAQPPAASIPGLSPPVSPASHPQKTPVETIRNLTCEQLQAMDPKARAHREALLMMMAGHGDMSQAPGYVNSIAGINYGQSSNPNLCQ